MTEQEYTTFLRSVETMTEQQQFDIIIHDLAEIIDSVEDDAE